MRLHLLDELIVDRFFDEQARGRDADLSRIEEDARSRALRRAVEIGRIGEDDVRRLAAAFQTHDLHVRFAGILQEELADFGRTGEGDGIDVHMPAERLAGRLAESGHDIEHAFGNARFRRKFGHAHRRQRRLFGGFQNERIAGGKRRARISSRHQQREIPRHHGGHHAERLARDHASAFFGVGAISS